jgi:hypothetical protein
MIMAAVFYLKEFIQNKCSPEVTNCKQCLFHIGLEPGSPREDVWYNQLCMAKPLLKKVDSYDGKTKYYDVNDIGNEYFTTNEFQFCRYINDGKCSMFQPKLH